MKIKDIKCIIISQQNPSIVTLLSFFLNTAGRKLLDVVFEGTTGFIARGCKHNMRVRILSTVLYVLNNSFKEVKYLQN